MTGSIDTLNGRQFATPEDMYEVFKQNQTELEWFAYFITGNELIAEACVVDARAFSFSQNPVFKDWLFEWARYTTIRSAIEAQRERQMLHSSTYERSTCVHALHDPLSPSTLEFVMNNDESLIKKLAALSRVALAVCGMEKHSLAEAAILAGVSIKVMREAYCAALQCIDVLQCEYSRTEGTYAPL